MKNFLKLICFQSVYSLPVPEPEKRQVKLCTRTTDQETNFKQDGVVINGTCFHVASICIKNDSETCPIGSICIKDKIKLVSFGEKYFIFNSELLSTALCSWCYIKTVRIIVAPFCPLVKTNHQR